MLRTKNDPVIFDAALRAPRVGSYTARPLTPEERARANALLTELGAAAAAARLGVAANTLFRAALGQPIRGFVAEQIAARLVA